jgi:hypothetical protein
MRKSTLARRNEKNIRNKEDDVFSEELDNALCCTINKVVAKHQKKMSFLLRSKQIDRLIVRILADQLYYAIHEERRF